MIPQNLGYTDNTPFYYNSTFYEIVILFFISLFILLVVFNNRK